MSDDALLSGLVADCLGRIEDGEGPSVIDEVCTEHPELVECVRDAVSLATELPGLAAQAGSSKVAAEQVLAGRYELRDAIGSGAVGRVHRALDLQLGREVAIKLMHGGALDRDNSLERFDREAEALAAIRHDSVVTIFDRGVTRDGQPFLVMELIDGVPYSDVLDRSSDAMQRDETAWLGDLFDADLDRSYIRQTLRWAEAIARGVEAAHVAGIYHRDLKPSNIIIRRDGRPVIIDFGIAMVEGLASLTRTNAAVGTLAYMPPESFGRRRISYPAVDVYGLSATLYHGLTHRPPYAGSATEVMAALATRDPDVASSVRPGIPRDVQAILDTGLARRPQARYASMGALADDLTAALEYRPVSVRPTSTITRRLRHIVRSRLLIGAAIVIAAVLGFALWREVATQLKERSKARFDKAWMELPANLGVVNPDYRAIVDANDRQRVLDTLDSLVRSGHQRATTLAMRGSFFFDHGRYDEAAADFGALANVVGTDYARKLADGYRTIAESQTPTLAGVAIGVPEPSSGLDSYLHALHAIRGAVEANPMPLLAHDDLDGLRHARELRFIGEAGALGRLHSIEQRDELFRRAELLARRIRRYEERTGYRSASTAQALTAALLRMERNVEVVQVATSALESKVPSYTLLQNRGVANLRLARYDEARRDLRSALVIAPNYFPLLDQLARVELEDGHLEAARQIVRSTLDLGVTTKQHAILEAAIEVGAALHLYETDADAANRAAQSALAACQRLDPSSPTRTAYEPIVDAIGERDRGALTLACVPLAARSPLNPANLNVVLQNLPDDLDQVPPAALVQLLSAIAHELARPQQIGLDDVPVNARGALSR